MAPASEWVKQQRVGEREGFHGVLEACELAEIQHSWVFFLANHNESQGPGFPSLRGSRSSQEAGCFSLSLGPDRLYYIL